MKVKEFKLNEDNKKTVMRLISQNKEIISEYKQNNSQELSKISNSKNVRKPTWLHSNQNLSVF